MNDNIFKNTYLKFVDRSDFVPLVEGDRVVFYYNGESGLKKSQFLSFSTGIQAEYIPAEKKIILEKLEKYYGSETDEFNESEEEDIVNVSDILSASYDDAPVIKLLNQIMINAVKADASDIHFESRDNFFLVRLRIDGKLRLFRKYPKNLQEPVIARIKVMSMLDVSETRRPQDGRINIKVGNRNVDMRVSVIPSMFGEKAVLRILEKTKSLITLDNIGIPEVWLKKLRNYLTRPNGIILVTGPTGSGKTTTLYASLLEMNRSEKNIVTIEDPVEYDIDGITQVQVNPSVDLSFSNALRSFLRQDPDVMLVGEIRDEETAKAAVQASLTGHLVLSTLHTNDAPTAVARLIEMDIEPFLISSSLILVVGQRLVRKICPACKIDKKVDKELSSFFASENLEISSYKIGKGCDECFGTGYKGRTALFEFLEITDEIRRLINRRASAFEIKECVKNMGFNRMIDYGFELIKQGLTTPEEVISITRMD